MGFKSINFREHIFSFILTPLVIVIGIVSYFRFVVYQDYMVGYKGACDPVEKECFVECDSDICAKENYYSEVQKYAPDLYKECGKDITGCQAANECLPEDRNCSITYCNKEIDGDVCDSFDKELNLNTTEKNVGSFKEGILQDNNIKN